MKYLLLIPFILAFVFSGCKPAQKTEDSTEMLNLYGELDREIARSHDYELVKESRINALKRSLDIANSSADRTRIVNLLIDEFNAYNADSALYYISYNMRRPAVRHIPGEYTALAIKRADVLAHAGLFYDALEALRTIPRDSITPDMLEAYYSTYCAAYQYLSEYNNEHETAIEHERMRSIYTDSVKMVVEPGSFNDLVYVMMETARNGDPETAIKTLSENLDKYESGDRKFSILASILADICKNSGNEEDFKRYIVLSAISDVRGAVKENMSFRAVATMMFEQGDVERVNRYLKKSIADANFYSAMLRNAQSSKMLPVIDDAYVASQNELTGRLRTSVWLSSILSVVLIVAIMLVLVQIKRIRRAKDKVSVANEELSLLSAQLHGANDELRRFNRTKEQYAGLFMEYCSGAISSLQRYQQSLRNLTVQGGNRASLLKKLETTEMVDGLLKNFYGKFDEAILNIYPSFIDKFNRLLRPDEQVVLKSGELLNTELRLYALIRIGIDDNAKIAEFLRCSISTVYTYRFKMKKRAINPETFEEQVRSLG